MREGSEGARRAPARAAERAAPARAASERSASTRTAAAPARETPAAPARADRRSLRLRPTLRAQLALVIALLSLLPNLVMAALVLLPTVRELGGLEPRTTATLLGWLVAVVALSGAIGGLLARVLLSPLTRITRDADALPRTAPRLARARLPAAPDDPPEVASLRGAMNRLLAQVQTEQARRSAFTATLMHDMKTPLLAQGNALRLLRDGAEGLTEAERRDLIEGALGETDTLLGLVQQLVDAHRFEQGEVRARRTDVAVHELIRAEAARLASQAAERSVRIEVHGEADAQADPELLARALGNLLSNAVRYAESRVTVEVHRGLVRIIDDGPGLPAPLDVLARPFNEQPATIAGRRYRAGTGGLGLYIARSILEAHGGRLVLETRGPGGTVLLAYLGSAPSPAIRGEAGDAATRRAARDEESAATGRTGGDDAPTVGTDPGRTT